MRRSTSVIIAITILSWVVLVPPTLAQSSSPAPRAEPGQSRPADTDTESSERNRIDGQGRNAATFRDRTQNDVERLRDQNSRRRDGNTGAGSGQDTGDGISGRTGRRSTAQEARDRARDGESDADGRDNDRESDTILRGDADDENDRRRDRDTERTREREDNYRRGYRDEESDDRSTRDRDDDDRSREDDITEGSSIRDSVRGDVRETVRSARDTARDARETARDAVRDVRGTVRDVRESTRETRRTSREEFDVNTVRSADVGIWFNRSSRNGLVINDIASSGPIAQVGFRDGDRIVSVNGYRVRDERQFVRDLFDEDYRNERVAVIVDRNGTQRTLYVEPETLVEHYTTSSSQDPLEQFGIVLDDRYSNQLVVWKVVPRTSAYYAGVRAADVITAWNNQRVTSKDQLVRALDGVSEGDEVWLTVTRNQQQRRLEAEITAGLASRSEGRTTYRPVVEDDSTVYPSGQVETYPSTERTRPVVPNRPTVVPRPGILPRNR